MLDFMHRYFLKFSAFMLLLACCLSGASPRDLQSLWEERQQSVVFLDFFVQLEVDRQPRRSAGLVLNDQGLLVFPESIFPGNRPPEDFRELRLFRPGESGEGSPAEYLGPDLEDGWHYVRAGAALREKLVPVTHWAVSEPRLGELVWGIGAMEQDFNYEPYLLSSTLAVSQNLPLLQGFAQAEVASAGSAVFDQSGAFVGWAGNPIPDEKILLVQGDRLRVGLIDRRDSSRFLFAEALLSNTGEAEVPADPLGDPLPWIGVAGLQPLEAEAARFLELVDQGAVVITAVLPEGPAEEAGLRARDIVVGIDGKPIPDFNPRSVSVTYLRRTLRGKPIGEPLTLEIVRKNERMSLTLKPTEAPTRIPEAERRHFEELGLAIREFTVSDAVARRELDLDLRGVVTTFVRNNGKPYSAGLRASDWIQEIDGEPVDTFDEAVDLIESALDATERSEMVLLVQRENETQVLRVKLD